MHDLAAAETQYHYRCYDNFRKILVSDNSEKSLLVDDEAMIKLVDEMYIDCKLQTWTSLSCMKSTQDMVVSLHESRYFQS